MLAPRRVSICTMRTSSERAMRPFSGNPSDHSMTSRIAAHSQAPTSDRVEAAFVAGRNPATPPQGSADTTQKGSLRERHSVRIVRPHHPLRGMVVPLVRLWEGKGTRFFVVELPDGGHCRLPASWVDDGVSEPETLPTTSRVLSMEAARELSRVLAGLLGEPGHLSSSAVGAEVDSERTVRSLRDVGAGAGRNLETASGGVTPGDRRALRAPRAGVRGGEGERGAR